jgi:hypothetical protein
MPRSRCALSFTLHLFLSSSFTLLGRGRGIQGFTVVFLLLLSFLFFSLDEKEGGVDDALRGRGGE